MEDRQTALEAARDFINDVMLEDTGTTDGSRKAETLAALILSRERAVIEKCARVAETYWSESDDPGDEPDATTRRDAALSVAAAIRSLTSETEKHE